MSQYIPDLTERFPEGFDGVDLTDTYFPSSRMSDEAMMWADMEREYRQEQKAERERQEGKHTCLNCYFQYEEYGMSCCKKHDMTLENESEECCEDWR